MHTIQRASGLVAVHGAADERAIERELERLDPRLFLSKEVDRRSGRFVYIVLCDLGGDQPPLQVCHWRGSDGRPLELSSGLLELVKSQRPRGRADEYGGARQMIEANAAHREKVRAEADAKIDAVAEEFAPLLRETHSAVLHRGTHLARSRRNKRDREAAALRARRAQAERDAYNRRRIAEGKEPV